MDPWSRNPKSLLDLLTLEEAKAGGGEKIMSNLGDLRFEGLEKWEVVFKSLDGQKSVVHYVKNPNTGEVMDFKFKSHSESLRMRNNVD